MIMARALCLCMKVSLRKHEVLRVGDLQDRRHKRAVYVLPIYGIISCSGVILILVVRRKG